MAKKKVSRQRENTIQQLSLVCKSGKYCLGFNKAIKSLVSGESKMILYASNIPAAQQSLLEYYTMLAHAQFVPFEGNNTDLGTACGKLFRSSVISILEAGESDILKVRQAAE